MLDSSVFDRYDPDLHVPLVRTQETETFNVPIRRITEIRMIVCAVLRQQKVSYRVISELLGYGDISSVHKAFKRFVERNPELVTLSTTTKSI